MADRLELELVQAENRALSRIIQALSTGQDLDQVLTTALDLVREATGARTALLYLYEEARERLVLKAATEPYRDMVGRLELDIGEDVTGSVAALREPALIPASQSPQNDVPSIGEGRDGWLLAAPLVSPTDQLVGIVNVYVDDRRDLGDRDVAFASEVASLLAATIERVALFRQVEEKEQALQRVIRRTVQAQEEERRRVATEIHDGVTQQLISIWYRVLACERLLERDVPAARAELEVAKLLIDEALGEARAAIYGLRPSTLDDLGLGPAIEALVRRTLEPEAQVSITIALRDQLPAHLETALYRICQETLANVRKHAQARRVEVTLESEPDEVRMVVVDDGKGFDVEGYRRARPETSFGLTGIAERVEVVGGFLDITSEAHRGTRLEVRVPVDRAQARNGAS